jgi:hypothetical protein
MCAQTWLLLFITNFTDNRKPELGQRDKKYLSCTILELSVLPYKGGKVKESHIRALVNLQPVHSLKPRNLMAY